MRVRVGASQCVIVPVTKLEFVEDHHRVQSVVPATFRRKTIPIPCTCYEKSILEHQKRGSFAPTTKRYRIEKDDSQHRSHQAHTAATPCNALLYLFADMNNFIIIIYI